MNKLIDENIIKKLKIYFQVPQLMHPYQYLKFNKDCLLIIKNQNRLIDANIYISGYNTKKNKEFSTIKDFINITNEYNIIFNIYIMKIIILY
jgi:hypothetical protein